MTEVTVDPVILTYAVRYALGRATYAPDDVLSLFSGIGVHLYREAGTSPWSL